MFAALCLDLDGTLGRRQGDFGAFLDGIRADLGLLACDFDAFGDLLRAELRRDAALTLTTALAATVGALGQRPPDDLPAIAARAVEAYAATMAPLPGALELVAWLRERRVPLALVTNGPDDLQRAAFARLGVADSFRAVIVSGDARVGARKPGSRPFALACEALGCRPVDVLMVGDTVDADITGALTYGMPAVRVGGAGGEGFHGVPDLATLRAWLDARSGFPAGALPD